MSLLAVRSASAIACAPRTPTPLSEKLIEAIALFTGQPFTMAMTPVQITMTAITLVVAAININDGETNAIEGMTHFVLFATFIMLSILGL